MVYLGPPSLREPAQSWLDFIASKWCTSCSSPHLVRTQWDALLDLARAGAATLPAAGSSTSVEISVEQGS